MESFHSGEDICVAQNADCHHEFHLNCIIPWLLQSQDCPCCRRDYLTITDSRRRINEPISVNNQTTGMLSIPVVSETPSRTRQVQTPLQPVQIDEVSI